MAPVTVVTTATLLRDNEHKVNVLDCPAESTDFEAMIASVTELGPDISSLVLNL